MFIFSRRSKGLRMVAPSSSSSSCCSSSSSSRDLVPCGRMVLRSTKPLQCPFLMHLSLASSSRHHAEQMGCLWGSSGDRSEIGQKLHRGISLLQTADHHPMTCWRPNLLHSVNLKKK